MSPRTAALLAAILQAQAAVSLELDYVSHLGRYLSRDLAL